MANSFMKALDSLLLKADVNENLFECSEIFGEAVVKSWPQSFIVYIEEIKAN